jgi:hypothetical protein
MQIAKPLDFMRPSRLPENINGPLITQLKGPVESLEFLWETTLEPRQISLSEANN